MFLLFKEKKYIQHIDEISICALFNFSNLFPTNYKDSSATRLEQTIWQDLVHTALCKMCIMMFVSIWDSLRKCQAFFLFYL